MLQKSGLAIVPWTPPAWATSRVFGLEAVEHCRHIGDVTPLGGSEPISVEVVQRDELNLAGDPAFVIRSEPQIRMAGVRLSADQARDLARRLNTAAAAIVGLCS